MFDIDWLTVLPSLKSVVSTLLALLVASFLLRLKRLVYGRWAVDIVIDGVTKDTEELSIEDASKVLVYNRPWWYVMVVGGNPTLARQTAVRQLLQSCVTMFGNVNCDIRDVTAVNVTRRRLVISLTSGNNFLPRTSTREFPG